MAVKTWCEEHGMQLFIISIVCLITVLVMGCSAESPSSGPPPVENPPPADPSFADVKPVIDRNCGKCHNGSVHPLKFDTAAKFKGSKAKARIANNTMPPAPAVMSAEDKGKLLAFLEGK